MEDVAAQVCTHVVRFFSVASMFPACREKMVEMPELVKNICRVFYYKASNLVSVGVCSSQSVLFTASLSHLRTMLPESSSCPQPAQWPNHAT